MSRHFYDVNLGNRGLLEPTKYTWMASKPRECRRFIDQPRVDQDQSFVATLIMRSPVTETELLSAAFYMKLFLDFFTKYISRQPNTQFRSSLLYSLEPTYGHLQEVLELIRAVSVRVLRLLIETGCRID